MFFCYKKKSFKNNFCAFAAISLIYIIIFSIYNLPAGKAELSQNVDAEANYRSYEVIKDSAIGKYKVLGWNNLGMHCMDADFSLFSILPPYNTILVQVIDDQGHLLRNTAGVSVTYKAIADSNGSINTTSQGKTNFWEYVHPLFGINLPVNVGLPVPGPNSFAMTGSDNIPQVMEFDPNLLWFAAYGIPITPIDDLYRRNTYPMMRIEAGSDMNTPSYSDIVLPVSDEMDCRACHSSGSSPSAMPNGGWIFDPNSQRDYRLNVLHLHDDMELFKPAYQNALAIAGYDSNGLYVNAAIKGKPVLCAKCHLSEALPGTGVEGVPPLTQSMHGFHAFVHDPTNNMFLEDISNISACYRCHPGSQTRCLRGVMGNAAASDGTMLIQCQNCHGRMSLVGSANRTGWLDEPKCQSCHTGTATSNNGQIRYNSVFDVNDYVRQAVNLTFATEVNKPSAPFSLYRFSTGHGGLYCEACHGSTHAEFPSREKNDNIYSIALQGHEGMLSECTACHPASPLTATGGPHGLHTFGQQWINAHGDTIENGGYTQCKSCHGTDYTGTVLSLSKADRTLNTGNYWNKQFWRGYRIGCYTCHKGPSSDTTNPNRPPIVSNNTITILKNSQADIQLTATDPENKPLTLRIISRPEHGAAGLNGNTVTYTPETDYVGTDSFTFAAWDGQMDSNLGTITITILPGSSP